MLLFREKKSCIAAEVAGLISAGIAATASGANTAAGARMNKKNRQWTEKQNEINRQHQDQVNQENKEWAKYMADYSYNQELEQWNRENAYNSPLAQMQRYQEAGLNPNLIYGQSNLSAGSPTMDFAGGYGDAYQGTAPQGDPVKFDGSFASDYFQNVSTIQRNELLKQQITHDVVKQKIDELKIIAQEYDNIVKGVNADNAEESVKLKLDESRQRIAESLQRITNMQTIDEKNAYMLENLLPQQLINMQAQEKQVRANISKIHHEIKLIDINAGLSQANIRRINQLVDYVVPQQLKNMQATEAHTYEDISKMYLEEQLLGIKIEDSTIKKEINRINSGIAYGNQDISDKDVFYFGLREAGALAKRTANRLIDKWTKPEAKKVKSKVTDKDSEGHEETYFEYD